MTQKLPDYLVPIPRDEVPKFPRGCDHDLELVERDEEFNSDCDHERWRCKRCGGAAWFEVLI